MKVVKELKYSDRPAKEASVVPQLPLDQQGVDLKVIGLMRLMTILNSPLASIRKSTCVRSVRCYNTNLCYEKLH